MILHLVYAVPSKGHAGRFKRIVYRRLQQLGLCVCSFGDRSKPNTSWWPKKSPYENTKNIFQELSSIIPVKLYSLDEEAGCLFSSEDIFLGHPSFPYRAGRKGVTELSINQAVRPRIFALISPLHCDVKIKTNHINKDYLDAIDRLLPQADILFGIMGEYWWDQWPSSPFGHWMPKMVRLDMAIDVEHFPRLKTRFNQPGKRGYLYIGRNDTMKGASFLSRLMCRLGPCKCGWVGSGPDIEGVPRISKARALTPDFMTKVAQDFDIFVSPSVADPNPTTILESMAWGFPVTCTPESGYYKTSYRRNIYQDDFDRSIEVLRQLQFADERELKKMANDARDVVERKYTWERFTGVICDRLDLK